jgi:hypothetical protein
LLPEEKRRLAIKFSVGQPDSEWPDEVPRITFAEAPPTPEWQRNPKWLGAFLGLMFGNVKPLAEALESTEPIFREYETFLTLALRGDARCPFRLVVRGKPLDGQKRAGRPRRGSRLTADALAEQIDKHNLHSGEYRRIVAAALRNDRSYPFRIEVKSNSRGRFPAQNGLRNLMLAVRMSALIEEKQKRGEREPYRAAARQIAGECFIGSSTVESAYEQNRILAPGMRQWAAELRDVFREDRRVSTKIQI